MEKSGWHMKSVIQTMMPWHWISHFPWCTSVASLIRKKAEPKWICQEPQRISTLHPPAVSTLLLPGNYDITLLLLLLFPQNLRFLGSGAFYLVLSFFNRSTVGFFFLSFFSWAKTWYLYLILRLLFLNLGFLFTSWSKANPEESLLLLLTTDISLQLWSAENQSKQTLEKHSDLQLKKSTTIITYFQPEQCMTYWAAWVLPCAQNIGSRCITFVGSML